MIEDSWQRWIKRGAWSVNLTQGLAAHQDSGCVFRIVREHAFCAVWVEATGTPPPLEKIDVMQTRAWAVFHLTERLVNLLNWRKR